MTNSTTEERVDLTRSARFWDEQYDKVCATGTQEQRESTKLERDNAISKLADYLHRSAGVSPGEALARAREISEERA